MSIFEKVTPAKRAKTTESRQAAYVYAGVLVILVLCQLFTFDKFLPLLDSFALPGGSVLANIVGGVIVIAEVFALPFLLELNLTALMRYFSIACGWLVPFVWFMLSLWLVLTANNVANIGLLGTVVDLVPGWWAVYISVALGILSAWASWGLWPGKRQ